MKEKTAPIARPTVQYPRLAAFLADCGRLRGTLPYHGVQGYLFIMQNSVCVTAEEECHRGIFGAADQGAYRAFCARPDLLNDFAELKHHIAECGASLLNDCALQPEPSDNFRHDAPVRQWALGFLRAYAMVRDWWTRPLPRLHSAYHEVALICLTAFADSKVARRTTREYLGEDVSLEWVARYASSTFRTALAFFVQSRESDIREWHYHLNSMHSRCSTTACLNKAKNTTNLREIASINSTPVDQRFVNAYFTCAEPLRKRIQCTDIRHCGNVEALIQDAFLAFYIRLHRGEVIPAPALALIRIVKNLVDRAQHERVTDLPNEATAPAGTPYESIRSSGPDYSSDVQSNDPRSVWANCLATERKLIRPLVAGFPEHAFLPYFYRTVLVMPYSEIAKRCAMTESQALVYTYRGLKLRQELLRAHYRGATKPESY